MFIKGIIGCGLIGKLVAIDFKGPQFESSLLPFVL